MKNVSYDLDVDLEGLRPERPPVVLLGGLNLLRPLGFAGIPTIVASPDPNDPALVSRYCSGRCLLPPFKNQQAAAETLLAVGDRLVERLGRRVPLFYGNDDELNLVYAYRAELSQRYLLLLNEPDVCRALIDKDRFEALAHERGLRVPRTLNWDGTGADALSRAAGPVLIKPKMKVAWDDSPIFLRLLGGSGKAIIFENSRKVMENPLVNLLRDQLTFQEYIPGDDSNLWSFHGVADENGQLLASFVGRKVRTFPSLTGMSTYLEMAHDDEIARTGRYIVSQVPLRGAFKIDMKKDARDGSGYLLEINARYNLWHHMAARNGVNLPQAAYDYLVYRKRPASSDYRTTYRWLYLRHDYRAFRELSSRGEMSLAGWLLSLLLARKVYDLFSWTDPAPFLHRGSVRLRSWLQRGLGHLRLRLRQWLSLA